MATKQKPRPRYYVSGISEFYWEIVDRRTDLVMGLVEKTYDDDNRGEAEEKCKRMNRRAAAARIRRAPKCE